MKAKYSSHYTKSQQQGSINGKQQNINKLTEQCGQIITIVRIILYHKPQ